MKRVIVPALIFLVVIIFLYRSMEQKVQPTFNVSAKSTEEITQELIIAFLIEDIARDTKNYYSQYYTEEIVIYNYEVKVLDVDKEDTKSITVKVEVTPQVGAHNPLGYDEIEYVVDARGNIALKNYEHIFPHDISSN